MNDFFVEPRIRRLVADHLGLGPEELTAETSLTDDLAADSLDLVELALAIEAEFGIAVPERLLEDIRTYGDLVDATIALRRSDGAHETPADATPALVWSRIVAPSGDGGGAGLQRAGALTPYVAETIAEDALSAGRGARLEVTVPASTNDAGIAWVQSQFAWLGQRGVQVSVHRDYQGLAAPAQRHPYAAA